MDFKDTRFINHCVREVKKTKEYMIESNRYNANKNFNFQDISFIHPDHLPLKKSLNFIGGLIKESNYTQAKKKIDEIVNDFSHQNTLEYALYLKYAAKAENEHGSINKAVSLSTKSIEIFKNHISELHPIMIETKLEYYLYGNYLSSKFNNLRSGILKCLINSILIGDKRLTVMAYNVLGYSYKVYGQLNNSKFYCNKSFKLYNKYKLNEYQLQKDIIMNIFNSLPIYMTSYNYFLWKNLSKFEKILLQNKDYKSLGYIYYNISQSKMNFLKYSSALEYLEKAENYLKMVECDSKYLVMCNLIKWATLKRMGRIGFSDKYLSIAFDLMKNSYGKTNFEWILFYHEIAFHYIIQDDTNNSLKYIKMASDLINNNHSNASPIKNLNYFFYIFAFSNQEMNEVDLKGYLKNFLATHRIIYGEESELTLTISILLYTKGKYKIFKEFQQNETI